MQSFHLSEAEDDPAGDDHPEESCVDSLLGAVRKIDGKMPLRTGL